MSDQRLRTAAALLAAGGLAIAGYLAWVHYAGTAPACPTSGCEQVQTSPYAEVAGMPVALLGVLGYAGILGTLWLRGEPGRTLPALLALVGFGYSAYLTYRELFTIGSVCLWCVASALLMTGLAALASARVLSGRSSASHPRVRKSRR